MTPEQTLNVLEFLAGAYPEREITHRVAATFSLALADADAESVSVAAVAYVRSGERFFPPPGALLEPQRARQLPCSTQAQSLPARFHRETDALRGC